MPWWWGIVTLLFGSGLATAVFRFYWGSKARKAEAAKALREERYALAEKVNKASIAMIKRINHGVREFQKSIDGAKKRGEEIPYWINPSDWWNGMYSEGMTNFIEAVTELEEFDSGIVSKSQVGK